MRVIGLIFLCMIPVFLGAAKREKILENGKIQSSFLRFFEHIQFQIQSFSRPQDEIFCKFEDKTLEKIGFLPKLRCEVAAEPCLALHRTLQSYFDQLGFSTEKMQFIENFSSNFGMQSKSAQLKDCEKLLLALHNQEAKEKEKRKNDATIAWTFGLCLGVGLFILLL